MAKSTRYFLQGGTNFTDFSLNYTGVTQAGQSIKLKGTDGLDVVYVGTGFTFDLTSSGGGEDKLYVNAASTDFTGRLFGSTLILTKVSDSNTVLKVVTGDRLIFTNGTMLTKTWLDAAKLNGTQPTNAPAVDNSVKTMGTVESIASGLLSAGQSYNATLKSFASGDAGTFGQVQAGLKLALSGTGSVDVVYVRQGTQVDFTKSGEGVDLIYLTGALSDYTKSVYNNTNLKLTSTTTPSEVVYISASDRIIFSNGSVLASDIKSKLASNVNPTIANLGTSWDATTVSPGLLLSSTVTITQVNDDVGSVTGTLSKGGSTDDTHPALTETISAALVTGEHVDVYDGANKLGTATVSGTTWSYADNRNLTDAQAVSYTAKVVNNSSQSGVSSGAYSLTIDTTAPNITSGATATDQYETVATSTVIYSEVATDLHGVSFSLAGSDGSAFNIDATTGEVKFLASPDFQTKSSYSFSVVATDLVGNTASQTVALNIKGPSASISYIVDNVAPVTNNITASGAYTNDTSPSLSGTINAHFLPVHSVVRIYDDSNYLGDAVIMFPRITWSFQDSRTLTNAQVVNYRAVVYDVLTTKLSEYSSTFTVNIKTSPPTPGFIFVLASTYTDDGFSASDFIGSDNQFQIEGGGYETGASNTFQRSTDNATWTSTSRYQGFKPNDSTVTPLSDGPYYYRNKVTDVAGNTNYSPSILVVVDHLAPSFDNSNSAFSVDENINTTTAVLTAHASDANTISYSLSGTDASYLNINSAGVVKLNASPNFEAKSSYSFSVIATDVAGSSVSKSVALSVNNQDDLGTATITGTKAANATLNVSVTDPDSSVLALSNIMYQWQSGTGGTWTDINGATASSLLLANGLETNSIRVNVTYTDFFGQHTATSAVL
jgi:hypothetical protein